MFSFLIGYLFDSRIKEPILSADKENSLFVFDWEFLLGTETNYNHLFSAETTRFIQIDNTKISVDS